MKENPIKQPDVQNQEVVAALQMYHFHDQGYDIDPEAPINSVPEIVHAIGIGAMSVYGIRKQEDNNYTVAFANENTEACYIKQNLTEAEMLEIFNTEYKGVAYAEMDSR